MILHKDTALFLISIKCFTSINNAYCYLLPFQSLANKSSDESGDIVSCML
jgi:hypothetical protein